MHIFGISRNRAQLLAEAAQNLRLKDKLAATAVAKFAHDRIDLTLEHFRKLMKQN